MSVFNCVSRTNHFHVKDVDAFCAFMKRVQGEDCTVDLFMEQDADGKPVFCFGSYGYILGVTDCGASPESPDFYDVAYEYMLTELQRHVADGDAIVLIEVGHEKLNFVRSAAVVITSSSVAQLDFMTAITELCRGRLGSDSWELQMNIPG